MKTPRLLQKGNASFIQSPKKASPLSAFPRPESLHSQLLQLGGRTEQSLAQPGRDVSLSYTLVSVKDV